MLDADSEPGLGFTGTKGGTLVIFGFGVCTGTTSGIALGLAGVVDGPGADLVVGPSAATVVNALGGSYFWPNKVSNSGIN